MCLNLFSKYKGRKWTKIRRRLKGNTNRQRRKSTPRNSPSKNNQSRPPIKFKFSISRSNQKKSPPSHSRPSQGNPRFPRKATSPSRFWPTISHATIPPTTTAKRRATRRRTRSAICLDCHFRDPFPKSPHDSMRSRRSSATTLFKG